MLTNTETQQPVTREIPADLANHLIEHAVDETLAEDFTPIFIIEDGVAVFYADECWHLSTYENRNPITEEGF